MIRITRRARWLLFGGSASRRVFQTARWRLVGWNVLVFGLLLVILGVAAYGVFNSRIYSGVDSDLRRQESRFLYLFPQISYYAPSYMSNYGFPDQYQAAFADPATGRVTETMQCPSPISFLAQPCTSLKAISNDALADALSATRGKRLSWSPGAPVQIAYEDLRTASYQHQPWRVFTF